MCETSDIPAFLSTNTATEALENINVIREKFDKIVDGGPKNIKAIYLKATNQVSLPIYINKGKFCFT
jgi:hypothetical protein